jgi:hypothetical protein
VVEIYRDDPGYILCLYKKRKKAPRPGQQSRGDAIRKQYYCATLAQVFENYVDRKPDLTKPSVKCAKEVLDAIRQAVEEVRGIAREMCPVLLEQDRRCREAEAREAKRRKAAQGRKRVS